MAAHYELRTLPCPLTEDDRADYAARNADLDLLMCDADRELDRAKAAHKAAVSPLKVEKLDKLHVLETGMIEKEIEVSEYPNYSSGMMEYVDKNSEVVSRRALTFGERQQLRIQYQN